MYNNGITYKESSLKRCISNDSRLMVIMRKHTRDDLPHDTNRFMSRVRQLRLVRLLIFDGKHPLIRDR